MTSEATELQRVLDKRSHRVIIAQTAPAVRVAFSEAFGERAGAFSSSLLVAALRKLGFDLVLDTNTAADLCITEEGNELLVRLLDPNTSKNKYPLFTSCCPGWLKLAANGSPELIASISTCKSPHMMFGSVMKHFSQELLGIENPNDVYICSVMPCVGKKGESDQPVFRLHESGAREIDNVITTKDLHSLLLAENITDPLNQLDRNDVYDTPFQTDLNETESGLGTGAGQLFGATGGVMEAAVRSVYELLTKKPLPRLELQPIRGLEGVKETIVPIHSDVLNINLRLAVVSGLGNAKKLLTQVDTAEEKIYDFVEVMACPGGCINGGGQPKGGVVQDRLDCIYALDRNLPIRRSHENPIVKKLYQRHLGGAYGTGIAKKVLHVEQQVYGNGKNNEREHDR